MTSEERFSRIETILDRVVETQLKIDTTMLTLGESHIMTHEQLQSPAAEVSKTQQGLQTLERQLRNT
jgi:hypothetical protein